MHVLDGNYLFTTPMQAPTGFFVAVSAGFIVLLLASTFSYWRRLKLAPHNPVMRRFIRRVAYAGVWYAAIGIFLVIMRYIELPYLGMPILMYLLILAMIVSVAFYVYDYSERYPLAVWKLQETHAERRYRPTSRARSEPQRVRPRATRGKRRR